MMSDQALTIVIKAVDNASAVIKNIEGNVKKSTESFHTAAAASTKVAVAMGAVAVAAGAFGYKAIGAAADLQSLRMGLDAVTGSSDESARQLIRLKEVAKLPGLGFNEAVQGAINLQAAGLSANTSERALKSFGNALATVGKGKAELSGVILALTQIASKGKVSAEEINQLNERIPQIRVAMKAAFGTADTEQLSKMGIDSETFINGIIKEFEKLPPVMGGYNIAVENLQDTWNAFLAGEGAKVLEWATTFVKSIDHIVANVLPGFITKISEMFQYFKDNPTALYVLAGAIAGALAPAFIALGIAVGAAAIALAPWIIGGAIIGGLVAGVVWLVKHWDELKAKVVEVWDSIVEKISAAADWIVAKVMAFGEGILAALKTTLALLVGAVMLFLDWLVPGWDVALMKLFELWGVAWDLIKVAAVVAFNAIKSTFTEYLNIIKGLWTEAWDGISSFFSGLWEPMKEKFRVVFDFIIEKINAAIKLYDKLKEMLSNPFKKAGNAAGTSVQNFINSALKKGNTTLGFEHGGIVNGARGEAVPIMAHGQERIIPAGSSGTGAGNVYTFNVNILNPVVPNTAAANSLRKEIDQALRDLVRAHKLTTV